MLGGQKLISTLQRQQEQFCSQAYFEVLFIAGHCLSTGLAKLDYGNACVSCALMAEADIRSTAIRSRCVMLQERLRAVVGLPYTVVKSLHEYTFSTYCSLRALIDDALPGVEAVREAALPDHMRWQWTKDAF